MSLLNAFLISQQPWSSGIIILSLTIGKVRFREVNGISTGGRPRLQVPAPLYQCRMQIRHWTSPCHPIRHHLMSFIHRTWLSISLAFKNYAEKCIYFTKSRKIDFQWKKCLCVRSMHVWKCGCHLSHSTYMKGRGQVSGVGSWLSPSFEIRSLVSAMPSPYHRLSEGWVSVWVSTLKLPVGELGSGPLPLAL